MYKLLHTAIILTIALQITEQKIHEGTEKTPPTIPLKIFRHKRMVDANEIEYSQVPFQVSLKDLDTNLSFCGGSIIASDWVLTAGHCVCKHFGKGKKDKNFVVVSGNKYVDKGDISEVADIICHKGFQPINVTLSNILMPIPEDDIALIQVRKRFKIGSVRQLVPLNFMQEKDLIGRTVNVSGWGRVGPYRWDRANSLHGSQMEIISANECYAEMAKYNMRPSNFKLLSGHICFRRITGFGFPWNGDSGGPAIVDDTQVGILVWTFNHSWGIPEYPFNTNHPALVIATNISAYRDWLVRYVPQLTNPKINISTDKN